MTRISLSLATAASLLALPGALRAAPPPAEIVQLPAVSVNEAATAGSDRPTLLTLETVQSDGQDFADLARQTASLAVNDAGARGFGQTVTLRGLGNTPFFSDASVVVYLDDVPLTSGFTFPSNLLGFAQMTIYRGPQAAAQFGQAGDAGVIQLVSPRTESDGGQAGVSAGSHGWRSFNASAFSGSGQRVEASIQVGADRRDGYITNTTLGRTVDDRESLFARGVLRYRPAEDWEISLQVLAQRTRDGAEALVPLGGPWFEVKRGKEGESNVDFSTVALALTHRLAAGTLKSTTSYASWNLPDYSNRLVVFGGFNFDSVLNQSQHTFTQELRWQGDQLSGGAFFSHVQTKGGASRAFSGFTVENSSFAIAGDTFALFGRANFTPAPGWRLAPGLRFEYAAKDFTRTEVVPRSSVIRRDGNWTAWLPSLALTRTLSAASDFTVTLSRGFKPGGYSAYTGQASLVAYDPQRTWGAEAAYSLAGHESKWSLVSRAYAYRVQGYQIERSFAVPNTGTDEYLVVNAGRARILGLELESARRLAPDLTLRAVAGLTEATLTEFTDPFTGASYSGKQAPYAPTGNASLQLDYRPARGFFGGAGVTWTGKTYYDEHETAKFSQGAYALLDAHAGYTFAHGSVSIFGRNLSGRNYYSAITPGVFHGTPGAPFTWGIELSGRW